MLLTILQCTGQPLTSPVTMLRNPGLDGPKAQDQVIRKKLWRPVQTKLEPLRRNHHRQRQGEK